MTLNKVKVRGSEELRTQLRDLGPQADRAGVEAMRTWAGQVRDQARKGVPVDTGTLQRSIESRVEPVDLAAKVGVWNTEAYYSRWVEQGNSLQEPQPFLLPAFERNRRKFNGHLRDAIRRRLG